VGAKTPWHQPQHPPAHHPEGLKKKWSPFSFGGGGRKKKKELQLLGTGEEKWGEAGAEMAVSAALCFLCRGKRGKRRSVLAQHGARKKKETCDK